MALSAYESFAADPLVFPIGGKNYELPLISIPDGRKLGKLIAGDDEELNALPAEEVWRTALGGLWDQFIEDGVPMKAAIRAGLAALAEYQYGREGAEAAWEAGADPKALEKYLTDKHTPNRAARRSKSTGVARKTPSPASTNGTKSPVK